MKKIIVILAVIFLFSGCATIAHKDITTIWAGLGVDLYYQSKVAVPADKIPLFIDAVDRLEKLYREMNNDSK